METPPARKGVGMDKDTAQAQVSSKDTEYKQSSVEMKEDVPSPPGWQVSSRKRLSSEPISIKSFPARSVLKRAREMLKDSSGGTLLTDTSEGKKFSKEKVKSEGKKLSLEKEKKENLLVTPAGKKSEGFQVTVEKGIYGDRLEAELLRIKQKTPFTGENPPLLPAVSVKTRKDYFYGREPEKEFMLSLLLNKETGGKLQVIHIIGEAGAGKTALAGQIYSNAQVVKSFQLRVWLTVPQKGGICSLVKKILRIVTDTAEDKTQSNDLELLLAKLGSYFAGKKFLLVLDNCLIEDGSLNHLEWEMLISCFGFTGSAIILTSTPVQGGFVPPSDHHLPLGLLPTMDCWSIFCGHASVDLGFPGFREKKYVGLEIVKKLGYLPLAAKMIGSFLQDKDLNLWTQTLGDELLSTRCHEKSNVPSFIILCFLDLPDVLRLCLAFLSIYPKGYQFKQKQVVHLWIALGFLCEYKNGSESMEEVGNEYISFLTWRSFLQRCCDGVSFIIHDLVHDLASYIIKMLYDRKHVLFYESLEFFRNMLNISEMINILRLLMENGHGMELWEERVLSLSHLDIIDLPPSIRELTALHFLDLSYSSLHALPDSIGDLYNLQTLLLTNCTALTSLPARLSDLINLRYLDIRGTGVQDMPPRIDRLTSLQTLTGFVVSRSSPNFEDLAGLFNIKTLAISNLHNVVDATVVLNAQLEWKVNLNDLKLQWGSGLVHHDHTEIEDKVFEYLEPPRTIKTLTVEHYYGAGFPSWLGNGLFWSLQSVKLCHCTCVSLPPLGQLPGLKHLVIEGFNYLMRVGPEFFGGTEAFQSLESLQFQKMLEWKEWTILGDFEFQYLRELSIIGCPKLVGVLPKKLRSLEKLEISGCYDLAVSLPMMLPTCEVWVQDSNEILMRSVGSVVEVSYRPVIVPLEGKESVPLSYSSGPSPHSEVIIEEPDVTPLDDTRSPSVKADVTATDPAVKSDYSQYQMETSSSEDEWSSFEMLRISNSSQLENKLPHKLDSLRIKECTYLEALPVSLLPVMPTLKELYLDDCYSLTSFPPNGFPVSLRKLYVSNCPKLELSSSSESTKEFEFLEHFCIGNSCDSLTDFPLDFFPKLKVLCLWDCSNLASFMISEEFQGDFTSLKFLEIRDCPNLVSFPTRGLPAPNMLSILLSNCKKLNNIRDSKNSLRSLKSLVLHECPALESSSVEALLPSSLASLSISFCHKLTPHKNWELHNLEYLTSFEIEGGCMDMDSFPEEKLLPSNISSLRISTLQSLKKLDSNGFQRLNELQRLEINCCSQLESLPEQGLPSSLIYLCIMQSPLLTQKLSSKESKDRQKVAHIRHIEIDGKPIC